MHFFAGNCHCLFGVHLTGRGEVTTVDWGNWYSGQLKGGGGGSEVDPSRIGLQTSILALEERHHLSP